MCLVVGTPQKHLGALVALSILLAVLILLGIPMMNVILLRYTYDSYGIHYSMQGLLINSSWQIKYM